MLKSVDSEGVSRSSTPLWRVGQKLSVSNFNGRDKKQVRVHCSPRISEESDERFITELENIPGKSVAHHNDQV